MKLDFITRLQAVQKVTRFSTTDMARWFGVKRMTMAAWLLRYNAGPMHYKREALMRLLVILEQAVNTAKFAKRLPVPFAVPQSKRANFIDQLRVDAINNFPKKRAAGRGSQVLGKDQQKQESQPAIR